jgi:predicted sulfurtransferase
MFHLKGVRPMMSQDQLGSAITVTLGKPGTEAASFQSSHLGTRSFEEVLARLRNEIQGAGLRVLNEIDPQKSAAHMIGPQVKLNATITTFVFVSSIGSPCR